MPDLLLGFYTDYSIHWRYIFLWLEVDGLFLWVDGDIFCVGEGGQMYFMGD